MNRTNLSRSVHPRPLVAAVAALLVALVTGAGAKPGNDNRAPELVGDCARLRVEAGNKVIAHAYAIGVQVYRWNGTGWVFVAPVALLYQDEGYHGEFATHYVGPTWESNSGSKVVGAVLERCTPDPDAIPWLLLKATSSEGPGIFHGVTFIQRVNTTGGLAPADPGDLVGDEVEVPYTAEYYFYRQQH